MVPVETEFHVTCFLAESQRSGDLEDNYIDKHKFADQRSQTLVDPH